MTQTPKEKAKELLHKFNKFTVQQLFYDKNGKTREYFGDAKECSLIAVDEILSLSKIASLRRDEVYMELEYWIEVKQEIENYDRKNI